MKAQSSFIKPMDPYTRAAYGFSQAYQMNMQAADRQRRANEPSTDAFVEELNDERTDLNYAPEPQAPTAPQEQSVTSPEEETAFDPEDTSALIRARQKVSKYLKDRG